MGAQELEVVDLDRMLAADLADNARHRIGMARAVERDARLVDVDAFERGREAVRIAFAANFAVGDDVEPRLLLRLDRQERRIVLRLGEIGLRDAPKLLRPHARRETARELGSIDQPFGLRVRPDQRRRQKHGGVLPRRSVRATNRFNPASIVPARQGARRLPWRRLASSDQTRNVDGLRPRRGPRGDRRGERDRPIDPPRRTLLLELAVARRAALDHAIHHAHWKGSQPLVLCLNPFSGPCEASRPGRIAVDEAERADTMARYFPARVDANRESLRNFAESAVSCG